MMDEESIEIAIEAMMLVMIRMMATRTLVQDMLRTIKSAATSGMEIVTSTTVMTAMVKVTLALTTIY